MKAILVTKALNDHQPLDIASLKLDRLQKRALLTEVAKNLRLMHQHHYQHNCLYPKHILLNMLMVHGESSLLTWKNSNGNFLKEMPFIAI